MSTTVVRVVLVVRTVPAQTTGMSFGGPAVLGRLAWMLVPWRWRRRARLVALALVVAAVAIVVEHPALAGDAWDRYVAGHGGTRRLDGPVRLIPTQIPPPAPTTTRPMATGG